MRLPQKFLLIMKLTTFILIISLAQLSARTFGQRISLSENNSPMERVLSKISAQSGYNFFYSDSDLKGKTVNIAVNNASIEETLRSVFSGFPLDYRILKKNIVVTKKPEPGLFEKIFSRAAAIDVHGTVLDEKGKGLAGVNVRTKDNSQFTITDAAGTFILRDVAPNSVIICSFIGYKTKEINASEKLSEIKLEIADSKLDEVQVIAYGKTSQRLSTGNVVTISAKDIEKSPVSNPMLALQARVPGISIIQGSGYAGSGIKVQIQGRSSLLSGTEPFYVIDGVPYNSSTINAGTVPDIIKNGSPLNFINPDDIESISILKDADATAIYGSRAANGAVLITTKSGNSGPLRVNFNLSQGIGQLDQRLKLMDTEQYLLMRREAIKNENQQIGPADYDLNGTWDQNRNTDWMKELVGKNATYSDINLGFSGGDANTNYSLSSTYRRNTNVIPGDFSNRAFSTRIALSTKSRDQRLAINLTGSYTADVNELPQAEDFLTQAVTLAPNAPSIYNADGSLNWGLNSSGAGTWNNPYANLLSTNSMETGSLMTNLRTSYEIAKGFSISSNFGYNTIQMGNVIVSPIDAFSPNIRPYISSFSIFNHGKRSNWIIEPQLQYHASSKLGNFAFFAGSSIQQESSVTQNIFASGFPNLATMKNIAAASSLSTSSASDIPYKYFGVFGKLSYDYKNKYLLNLSARRDGSSRFGANNRYHNFSSIGLGWVLSEEGWAKDRLGPLNFAKIRISYGSTGNDQIEDFLYESLYLANPAAMNYGGIKGFDVNRLSNPDLQWEETRKLNLGLDLGLFNDRAVLNLNYNRNRSSNMLVFVNLPSSVGFGSVKQNLPALVENTGFEVALNTKNITSADFGWTSNFNLTIPRNKLLKYEGIESSQSYNLYFIGKSINVAKSYDFAGVNPQNGSYEFRKADGSITSYPTDADMYIHTDFSPRLYGGLENTFSYKGLALSFLFQFVRQQGRDNKTTTAIGVTPGQFGNNALVAAFERWTTPGQQASYQRFSTNYALNISQYYYNQSNGVIADASFIRLKNVNLSYVLPVKLCKKIHLNNLRVFAQGQNLLSWTKFSGLDPETTSSTSLPALRVMTLGLQGSF